VRIPVARSETVMKSPIFIIGTQRSGTTLLCRMLTAHPNVFIKNELPDACSIFAEQLSKERVLCGIDAAIQESYHADLKTFLEKIGKTRWGVKDPRLTYCLKSLTYHFPDARMIFIIRDGRAVANSNIKNRWGIATNTYYGAELWKKEIRMQKEFIKKNIDNCYFVKYENLISNTKLELVKICDFLDEKFPNDMIHYYKTPSYINKTKLNENAFNKVDANIASKWKEELSKFQINIFESIAGDELENNGYELVGEKIKVSKLLKCLFYLQQKIIGETQLQYQLRLRKFVHIKY
jgi:hypothetical protein